MKSGFKRKWCAQWWIMIICESIHGRKKWSLRLLINRTVGPTPVRCGSGDKFWKFRFWPENVPNRPSFGKSGSKKLRIFIKSSFRRANAQTHVSGRIKSLKNAQKWPKYTISRWSRKNPRHWPVTVRPKIKIFWIFSGAKYSKKNIIFFHVTCLHSSSSVLFCNPRTQKSRQLHVT